MLLDFWPLVTQADTMKTIGNIKRYTGVLCTGISFCFDRVEHTHCLYAELRKRRGTMIPEKIFYPLRP